MTVVNPIAMISSTVLDLEAQRQAALDACLRRDFIPKMMEHDALVSATALEKSMALVDEADVYVLIVGFRYGLVPEGREKSLTHLELERAQARGIPRIRLLMDESAESFAANGLSFASIDKGDAGARVGALREQLRREGATPFASPADLRAELIDALATLHTQLGRPAAPMHHSPPLVSPPTPFIAHPYTLLDVGSLVGRQQELNLLTDWVTRPDSELAGVRLLVVEAVGGMGKSAVIWHWFDRVAPLEMRPLAGRVWWSFYETDARFDSFVTRTLAYTTGMSIDEVLVLKPPEREDLLLDVLDREPFLVVLDGLERLLIAYARLDAAYLADDDLDEPTANTLGGFLRLRTGTGVPVPGRARLRTVADPRAGSFLRRLALVRTSRVVASSRLYPTDLESALTGEPIRGTAGYRLLGLADDDAVDLWRSIGVSGRRDELVKIFNSIDNYPLLIRALAGEVARFRPAPGDFDAWLAAHPAFDPFSLPLVNRKSHVLLHALDGLRENEMKVLHLLSAFRAPTTYGTLVDLLVGTNKVFNDESALDVALSGLEERSLLGWDKRANRYDLHPVVRGVAWATMDDPDRLAVNQDLARHFEALPVVEKVSAMDELTPRVELFNILIRLGRAQAAFDVLDRMNDAIQELGAFRVGMDISELFIECTELMDRIDRFDAGRLVATAGIFAMLSGEPRRALEYFSRGTLGSSTDADNWLPLSGHRAWSETQAGALAEADRSAREGLSGTFEDENEAYVPCLAFGKILVARTDGDEASAWFRDARWEDDGFRLLELGRLALRRGDLTDAQRQGESAASVSLKMYPNSVVGSASLVGAAMLRQGDIERAGEVLHAALVDARGGGLRDEEAELLTLLAEWELANERPVSARDRIKEVSDLMQHDPLRLRQADAMNMLSRIEQSVGDTAAAADAATRAYRYAWCDGPPFAYAFGLAQATANLAAVGAGVPGDLPPYTGPLPGLLPEVPPWPNPTA